MGRPSQAPTVSDVEFGSSAGPADNKCMRAVARCPAPAVPPPAGPKHPPLPSREAVASSWESGDQCRPHTMRVCALMRPTSLKGGPLGATVLAPEAAAGACCRSNTATVRSRLAEARNLPSGLKASWVTAAAEYGGVGQVRRMQSFCYLAGRAERQVPSVSAASAPDFQINCPQTLPVSVWAASWAAPVHLAVSHSQMVAVSADWARQADATNWPRGSAGRQRGKVSTKLRCGLLRRQQSCSHTQTSLPQP